MTDANDMGTSIYITTHDEQGRMQVRPYKGAGVIQRDAETLEDLQRWLDAGGTYGQYIIMLSRQTAALWRQRNFLRSIVDRTQYPEVDDWLWIEQQANQS